MQVNTSEIEIIRARQRLAEIFGGSLDAKRPTAWVSYGYRDELTFDDYLNGYTRHPAAHGAIHRLLDGCWQKKPRIKQSEAEDVTDWETKLKGIFKALKAWSKLRDFDRRNMIGRYAGLIYRLSDGQALDQPVTAAANLVEIVPVYEGQLKVTEWDSDVNSNTYGKPRMYQYRKKVLKGDTQAQPDEWANVHPDRVQIMAEGSVGDMFDGVPMLRAGFNALVDLEKVGGGSAESYLKNSSRAVTFTYDPQATPATIGENGQTVSVKDAHEAQVRALNSNIDAAIVTQGATVGTLQTTIADPTGSFNVAANLFAASVRLPFTVVFGQQTGRLASDEDRRDAAERYKARQDNELTPMLTEFVNAVIRFGMIEDADFVIEWPDVFAPSDDQKLSLAKKMADVNEQLAKIGMEPAFSAEEIRQAGGYDPKTLPDAIEAPPEPAPAAQ